MSEKKAEDLPNVFKVEAPYCCSWAYFSIAKINAGPWVFYAGGKAGQVRNIRFCPFCGKELPKADG